MKRREFVKNGAGLFTAAYILSTPLAALANMTEEQIKEDLKKKHIKNNCHSLEITGEEAKAMLQVNPTNESGGIWLISNSCKSPHKHLAYIPADVVTHPSLITESGMEFKTSLSYDRGLGVLVNDIAGRHHHTLKFSKDELLALIERPQEIEKIAYQPTQLSKLNGGIFYNAEEAGHIFVFKS